jgi:predicted Na+-dependent transporter
MHHAPHCITHIIAILAVRHYHNHQHTHWHHHLICIVIAIITIIMHQPISHKGSMYHTPHCCLHIIILAMHHHHNLRQHHHRRHIGISIVTIAIINI